MSASSPTPVSPLLKPCRRCKVVQHLPARSDNPSRPRPYCAPCNKEYLREWRAREWKRRKAYDTWKGMVARCHDPTHGLNYPPGSGVPSYRDYGAKGVSVCRRWRDADTGFEAFLSDLGLPPHPSFTLDRRDPHGNYTPRNAMWVHPHTQRANRKNSRWVEARNPTTMAIEIHTLSDWQRISGLDRRTIARRLDRGWEPDRAVSELTPMLAVPQASEVPF